VARIVYAGASTSAGRSRMDAELALARHQRLHSDLEVLVAGHPVGEWLRGQLMLALYRAGRQADALRVFQEGRTVLAEELGPDPVPSSASSRRRSSRRIQRWTHPHRSVDRSPRSGSASGRT